MGQNIEDSWVEVEGLHIHYLMAGERNVPVLLLHGGGFDSASLSYGSSIGPLSRQHNVIAPDWPGYGESGKPKMRYTTEYYVDFLGRLMDVLGLEKASLVGISMGGAISLGFSLRSPQRVERLVLVDSYGLGKEVPWRVMSYITVRLPLLNRLIWASLRRSRGMVERSLQSVLYDPRAVTSNLVDKVYRLAQRPGVGRAWRSWQRNEIKWGGLRTNFVDRLHEVAVPTLILHGEEDKYIPVSWARRAHSLIEGSELLVFPRCGHWLTLEKPGEFVSAASEFLARG